jgi:guanine deaminase
MATEQPGRTLIRNGRLATAELRRAAPCDILIEDGVIREMGAALAAPDDAEVFDATGLVMHPGLINAHTHGHGGLSRGQGDRWTLELLLAAAPWTGGGRSLQDKKLTTLICAAEMVAKGCTAAYDLFYEFPVPSRDGLDAVAEAYHEVGMRAVVAPMVADRSLYEAIPGLLGSMPEPLQGEVAELRLRPPEETLAAIGEVLDHWSWAKHGIRAAVAPTIPLHCSDAFMCGCRDLARKHGLPLHSHVGESKVQAVTGIRRYGRTLLAQMDALELVDERFTAAHAIWLDDDDLRLIRDRGASLAHNPGSNMRLGNGMFRLKRAIELGVNVGIGTDGVNCSDNGNMYEAMRLAAMTSHAQTPDPRRWAAVEEVYHAATVGSARALGFSDIGRLLPGMKADIVFLDLESLVWIPHNWTVNQIVHAEDSTGVKHTMIGGGFVYRDRRHTRLDIGKLARDAEAARERLEALSADMQGLYERLAPVVASFCPALAAQPYHLNRYMCDAPANGI